nr:unnamed protein product [Digitaria exilis]
MASATTAAGVSSPSASRKSLTSAAPSCAATTGIDALDVPTFQNTTCGTANPSAANLSQMPWYSVFHAAPVHPSKSMSLSTNTLFTIMSLCSPPATASCRILLNTPCRLAPFFCAPMAATSGRSFSLRLAPCTLCSWCVSLKVMTRPFHGSWLSSEIRRPSAMAAEAGWPAATPESPQTAMQLARRPSAASEAAMRRHWSSAASSCCPLSAAAISSCGSTPSAGILAWPVRTSSKKLVTRCLSCFWNTSLYLRIATDGTRAYGSSSNLHAHMYTSGSSSALRSGTSTSRRRRSRTR